MFEILILSLVSIWLNGCDIQSNLKLEGKKKIHYTQRGTGYTWSGKTNLEGQPEGNGVAIYQEREEGHRYEGKLIKGLRNGKGKYTMPNRDVYVGEWKDDKLNGKGKYILAIGHVYEGDFEDGLPNGQGKLVFANGNEYEGGWKKGMFNGQGKYTWADGKVYEGGFKDDKMHGNGKIIFGKGKVYEGKWKEGKPIEKILN